MQIILLILGLAVLAGVTAVTLSTRRRESRALLALVVRRRLNFSPEDLIDLHERYYRLSIIRRGHNHFAWNLLYGTMEEGLVSLFCYRCDLGFGVNQSQRVWWLAVMETTTDHAAWQAERPAIPDPLRTEKHEQPFGQFLVRTEEITTIEKLRAGGLEAFLGEYPTMNHAEIRHQLVCVAAPYEQNAEAPERLLEAACRLAGLIKDI